MKLYTHEEVRKAIELSRDTHQEGRPYMERDEYDYSMDEVVDLLTPIELPSDEEIEEKLNVAYGNGYEQGEMDFYKKMQVEGNQYADGYAEGYQRALELVKFQIVEQLEARR
jgi:hypothetical protein